MRALTPGVASVMFLGKLMFVAGLSGLYYRDNILQQSKPPVLWGGVPEILQGLCAPFDETRQASVNLEIDVVCAWTLSHAPTDLLSIDCVVGPTHCPSAEPHSEHQFPYDPWLQPPNTRIWPVEASNMLVIGSAGQSGTNDDKPKTLC